MVDMAHDGDDRRTGNLIARLVGLAKEAFFDVRIRDALHRVAHLFRHELRGIRVDRVSDLVHLAHLHEQADHIHAAFRHAVREFLDGDGLGQHDFAHDLLARFVALVALHALHAALERGHGTLALILIRGDGRCGEATRAFSMPGFGFSARPGAGSFTFALRGASSSSKSAGLRGGTAPGVRCGRISPNSGLTAGGTPPPRRGPPGPRAERPPPGAWPGRGPKPRRTVPCGRSPSRRGAPSPRGHRNDAARRLRG